MSILSTALALPQTLAFARGGGDSKEEEMIPPSSLVTLSAEIGRKPARNVGFPNAQ